MAGPFFVGVDVGTGSARAGVFDAVGTLLTSQKHEIRIWRDAGEIVEQSSADIWDAVCRAVRGAVAQAAIEPDQIGGLGFDAACSLVMLDEQMQPLSVSLTKEAERNVIVWMDHRAIDQTERINATGHPVLDYVGGRVSPEMQTPKLLWLKENLPEYFASAGQFFDLVDFLTWSATGSLTRSACTVACKWTYLAHEDSWDSSYFRQIGLGKLADEDYARIGQQIAAPGTPLGNGLTNAAAQALGLRPDTPVGAGLIDAHAGGIGTVGADTESGPEAMMGYVFGTSACTMASSVQPNFVPGVWGPYYSAMVPGLWLSEGGQSAAGEAIAHLIATHPAREEAQALANAASQSIQAYLLSEAERRCPDVSSAVDLAGARIIVPEFLGNRAPYADPNATAVISGLTLQVGFGDLLATYIAGVFGVGYGLRQIIEAQRAHGLAPSAVVISGGAGESDMMKQLLADASGLSILSITCPEPVLLGAAMLGGVASGHYRSLQESMKTMSHISKRFTPAGGRNASYHDFRFKAYETLQSMDRDLRAALKEI